MDDAPPHTTRAATVKPHARPTPEADATPRARVATGLDVAAMGKLMTQPTTVQERDLTQRILQYIVDQGGPTTILQRASEGHDRTSNSSNSCRRYRSTPTTGEEEEEDSTSTTSTIPDVPQPSRRPTSQGWDYFTLLTPSDPRWRKHQHTHACTLCADNWSVALSHRPSKKPGFVTYQITPLNRHLRKFHPDLPYCHTLEANALRNRQNKTKKFEDEDEEDANTVSRKTT